LDELISKIASSAQSHVEAMGALEHRLAESIACAVAKSTAAHHDELRELRAVLGAVEQRFAQGPSCCDLNGRNAPRHSKCEEIPNIAALSQSPVSGPEGKPSDVCDAESAREAVQLGTDSRSLTARVSTVMAFGAPAVSLKQIDGGFDCAVMAISASGEAAISTKTRDKHDSSLSTAVASDVGGISPVKAGGSSAIPMSARTACDGGSLDTPCADQHPTSPVDAADSVKQAGDFGSQRVGWPAAEGVAGPNIPQTSPSLTELALPGCGLLDAVKLVKVDDVQGKVLDEAAFPRDALESSSGEYQAQ